MFNLGHLLNGLIFLICPVILQKIKALRHIISKMVNLVTKVIEGFL